MNCWFISCKRELPGYQKYQTFDEYSLKGITDGDIYPPYVYVKKGKDTICVLKSDNLENNIKYVNMGDYWYSFLKIEDKPNLFSRLFYKCWDLPVVYEKFIFNDTIMMYKYMLNEDLKIIDSDIIVKTYKYNLYISVPDSSISDISDKDNLFRKMKNIVINYKKYIPKITSNHETSFYRLYEKVINQHSYTLYDNESIVAEKKMENLGEFGLDPEF